MTTRADLRAVLDVLAERTRQDAKWGEQNHPDGDPVLLGREGGVTPRRLAEEHGISTGAQARRHCQIAASRGQVSWLDILAEEIGEANDEVALGNTAALRDELVQSAAVLVAWDGAIHRRVAADPVRVYVSGPIASDPDARQHFADVAADINTWDGFEAVNPFDIAPLTHPGQACAPGYHPGDGEHEHTSSACYMRTDLLALLSCDLIYLLRGWERSKGAGVEHAVARACGMEVIHQPTEPCSGCGGTGLVDWYPGQIRHLDDEQQPCSDCTARRPVNNGISAQPAKAGDPA